MKNSKINEKLGILLSRFWIAEKTYAEKKANNISERNEKRKSTDIELNSKQEEINQLQNHIFEQKEELHSLLIEDGIKIPSYPKFDEKSIKKDNVALDELNKEVNDIDRILVSTKDDLIELKSIRSDLSDRNRYLMIAIVILIMVTCFICVWVIIKLWPILPPRNGTESPTIPISTTEVINNPNPSITKPQVTEPVVIDSPTPTKTPVPSIYRCPDLSDVKLEIGARAEVQGGTVNLRYDPSIPIDWHENIKFQLKNGVKMTIIGGPKCAHDGTWWEVKTDSGLSGWIREFTSDRRLIMPVD